MFQLSHVTPTSSLPLHFSAQVAKPALVLNLEAGSPTDGQAERPQMLLIQTTELVAAAVDAALPLALVLAVPEHQCTCNRGRGCNR